MRTPIVLNGVINWFTAKDVKHLPYSFVEGGAVQFFVYRGKSVLSTIFYSSLITSTGFARAVFNTLKLIVIKAMKTEMIKANPYIK